MLAGLLALAAPGGSGAATLTISSVADEITTNGACSLREAVRNANSNAATHPDCPAGSTATDTIIIPAGFYVVLTRAGINEGSAMNGDLDITDAAGQTVISGGGFLTTAVSGNNLDRVFEVGPGAAPVRISGVRIEKGNPQANNGGGILNNETLTLTNALVTGNTISAVAPGAQSGGGVANASGTLTILRSSISGNSATGTVAAAGGVGQIGGESTLRIEDSVISGNTADGGPGGLEAAGRVTLEDVVIAANKGYRGGGLGVTVTTGKRFDARDLLVHENEATTEAGGMWLRPFGPIDVRRATISRNRAVNGDAGGVQILQEASASVSLSDVTIAENTAFTSGGGLRVEGPGAGSVSLTRATIASNNSFDGDGISNALSGGTLTVTNATITGNGTTGGGDGGGVNNATNGNMLLANVTLSENTAGLGYGGGNIWNDGALTVRNSIAHNPLNGGQCALAEPLSQSGRNLEHPVGAAPCGFAVTGDPELGPLDDNGGPTQTRALQQGSAAVNRGLGCATADQRRVPRSLGGRCDIGAYERVLCFGEAVDRVGTNGNDRMTGGPGPQTFLTLGGNDSVDPRGGADRLCLGGGNDTARIRGAGADRADGQAGSDLVIRDSNDVVRGFERFG